MKNVPDKINMFNVYKSGKQLIGITDEVSLPDLEALSETVSGAGILGEIDSPAIGQFGSIEIEIPFRVLDSDMFSLASPLEMVDLTLRASEQILAAQNITFKGMRVVTRGMFKGFTAGSVKAGSPTNSSVKLELIYYLIEVDGKKLIELDKLNSKYKINGKDILAKAASLC